MGHDIVESTNQEHLSRLSKNAIGNQFDWITFSSDTPFIDDLDLFVKTSIAPYILSGDLLPRSERWYRDRITSGDFVLLMDKTDPIRSDITLEDIAENAVGFAFLDHFNAPMTEDGEGFLREMTEICSVRNVGIMPDGRREERTLGVGREAFQAAFAQAVRKYPSSVIVSWVHPISESSLRKAFSEDTYTLTTIPDDAFTEEEYRNPPHVCVQIERREAA